MIWNLVSNLELKPRLQTLTSHRRCPSEFKLHISKASYCASCLSLFYTVAISNFLHFFSNPSFYHISPCSQQKTLLLLHRENRSLHTVLAWPQPDQVIYMYTLSLHPNPSGALVYSHHRDQDLSIISFLDPSHQYLSIFSKKKFRRLLNSTLSLRYHHLSSLCSQNSQQVPISTFSPSHSLLNLLQVSTPPLHPTGSCHGQQGLFVTKSMETSLELSFPGLSTGLYTTVLYSILFKCPLPLASKTLHHRFSPLLWPLSLNIFWRLKYFWGCLPHLLTSSPCTPSSTPRHQLWVICWCLISISSSRSLMRFGFTYSNA